MSHIVSIDTKVHDPAAIAAACQRLGLAEPVQGKAKLYSGEAEGLLLQLPGWQYPAVIDTATGACALRQLRGPLGRAGPPGPLPADVRRGEGEARGPQEGLPGQRAGPPGRQHQAADHRGA